MHRSIALIVLLLLSTPLMADDWIRKQTGADWSWGEDYVFLWAKYQLACEPDRRCQVGAGWKIGGKPRGEKLSFAGDQETILVVGPGALHFRPSDGKGPVKYAFRLADRGLIKTPEITW